MKVALFEVCRRPEILKPNTEAILLSECFKNLGIRFDLYTNDGYWEGRLKAGAVVDKDLIQKVLINSGIDVVHFAVHGGPSGLILRWGGPIDQRVEVDVLTGVSEMNCIEARKAAAGAGLVQSWL